MQKVRVTCGPISPLMMDRMPEEVLDGIAIGVPVARPKDTPPKVIAERALYSDGNGGFILPIENLWACLIEAGRRVKIGRYTISTAKSTELYSLISINVLSLRLLRVTADGTVLDGHPTWVIDKRRGVGKKAGDPVRIVRPKFAEWGFSVEVEFDEKQKINASILQQLFERAGTAVGLCSFRPQKRGPFGRFRVVEWEMLNGAEPADTR